MRCVKKKYHAVNCSTFFLCSSLSVLLKVFVVCVAYHMVKAPHVAINVHKIV